MASLQSLNQRIAQFGPGLLYAGAAIGVSHLVQSTRAGADFGWDLVWIIVLVNIIKYPVFQTGPRFAAATGETLLHGYKKLGSWAVWIYIVMTICTMFVIMAAISIVTAGLFLQLTGLNLDAAIIAVALLAVSALMLSIGHYQLLDKVMKGIVLALTCSTLIALAFAFGNPTLSDASEAVHFDFGNEMNLLFLVALVGWMPAPVDISIWHSVWSVAKNQEVGERVSMKTAMADFNVGYWGTTVLAVCFLALGALVMYGSGEAMALNSLDFAGQLIHMYTKNLGSWAFPLIALAAFTTMFSTLLTCLDAFPRTLKVGMDLNTSFTLLGSKSRYSYWIWILITAAGTSGILLFLLKDMRSMVDFATTVSFVLAPVLATLNYFSMNHKSISSEMRQPMWLRIFNLVSIALLTAFSIWFLLL